MHTEILWCKLATNHQRMLLKNDTIQLMMGTGTRGTRTCSHTFLFANDHLPLMTIMWVKLRMRCALP